MGYKNGKEKCKQQQKQWIGGISAKGNKFRLAGANLKHNCVEKWAHSAFKDMKKQNYRLSLDTCLNLCESGGFVVRGFG